MVSPIYSTILDSVVKLLNNLTCRVQETRVVFSGRPKKLWARTGEVPVYFAGKFHSFSTMQNLYLNEKVIARYFSNKKNSNNKKNKNSKVVKKAKGNPNQNTNKSPTGKKVAGKVSHIKHINGTLDRVNFSIYNEVFPELINSGEQSLITKSEITELFQKMVLFHDKLIANHGIKEGTKRFKSFTLYCTNLLEGKITRAPEFTSIGQKDF